MEPRAGGSDEAAKEEEEEMGGLKEEEKEMVVDVQIPPRPRPRAPRRSWQLWALPELDYVFSSNQWDAAGAGVLFRVSEAMGRSASKGSGSGSEEEAKKEEETAV